MRYLKAIMLALLFVVSMLFFVQNNGPLSTSLQLEFNLITLHLISIPLPLYLFVLAAFLLGVVFSLSFLLVDRIRLSLELKALRRQHAALEDEALALRTLPLNQTENKPHPGV
ncbi:MAG: LapA family protein [Humidesulfovibrio sp.]|uniref:LapA family protein n=1 Tax=Humidesulfovibrio sp. TaxID=2910988 RepID=UPI0027FA8996|nr:LapA family protein [Humidesulfovibrio sp.]MDQ7834448.1 LapA family protein [Humidesulfovibrio sp.]